MFKKKNIIKFLFFYLGSKLILMLLIPVAASNFFQIFSLEESGNPDLVFNDLYFRAKNKDCLSNKHYTREKSVVLINTGSLSTDSFRLELAKILIKLKNTDVKAIGIDHDFLKINKIGTEDLKREIESNPKIVYSYRPHKDDGTSDKDYYDFKAEKGKTNLPDIYTIRRYESDPNTFGAMLVKMSKNNPVKHENKHHNIHTVNHGHADHHEPFNINYCSVGDGLCAFDDYNNKLSLVNFTYIEAKDFLRDSANFENFQSILKDKILILGHLGTFSFNKKYDIEDKFSVPIDSERIMMREKTMHGAVIHANAIENLLHPETMFFELHGIWHFLHHEILFVLFLIVLMLHLGKLYNILILAGISIPYIIGVMYMMENQIYIAMTSTLLHLMFIEEFYEILEPFYVKLSKKLKYSENETDELH